MNTAQEFTKKSVKKYLALLIFFIINISAIFSDVIIEKYNSLSPAKVEENTKKPNFSEHDLSLVMEHISLLEEKYHILNDKYKKLENDFSKIQNQENESNITILYFELIQNIENNQDYQAELIKLKSLINKNSSLYNIILTLEEILAKKVATNLILIENFDKLIPRILNSKLNKNSNDSILEKIKNNILESIQIRKIKFKKNFEQENIKPNIDYIIFQIEENLLDKKYQNIPNLINKIKTGQDRESQKDKKLDEFIIEIKKMINFQQINQEILLLLQNNQ
jgi:hypothetical protein